MFKPSSKVIQYVSVFALSIAVKIAIVMAVVTPMNAAAQTTPSSFADLAEKLLPTVVNISSIQNAEEQSPSKQNPFGGQPSFPGLPENHPFNDMFNDFFEQQAPTPQPQNRMPASAMGSGFIIDKGKGLIITNNHVIKDADEIKVTLHNDTILSATLVGSDKKTDIAVLKVDFTGQNVTETSFGDSDIMRVGDWIVAIGNPFGLGGTVTAGIISARARDIQSGPYDDYIQTDASINHGNSGGPMFNLNGEVIGINTAIFSPTGGSVGIGFAIPSALAKPVINQLVDFGRTRRGWLGVRIQTVTEDIASSLGLTKPAGALVADVTKTGPAEAAKIQAGDVILAFDNKPVREMRNLPRIVAETNINTAVPVILWRNGKRVSVSVTIGELEKAEDSGILSASANDTINEEEDEDKGELIGKLGLTVMPLNDALRDEYALSADMNGLIITDIDSNSDAAKEGITTGDVITDINQKSVTSPDDLKKEIKASLLSGRNAVLLLINSQDNIQFVAVKLEHSKKDK